jgi:hypothetical protein
MFCSYYVMEKKGGIFAIIGLIILVLLIGTAFYFYSFHVFKTVRVCVGDATDTKIPCNISQECVDIAIKFGSDINLSETPNFIQEEFQKVSDEAIYCDNTCFVKEVRGMDLEIGQLELLESCDSDETEFKIDIHGKEGIEIFKWLKEKGISL